MAAVPIPPHVQLLALVVDLSGERRGSKPWLPDDDRDVVNGLVIPRRRRKAGVHPHGAMNRVDAHRRIYRCSEYRCGVGAEVVRAT